MTEFFLTFIGVLVTVSLLIRAIETYLHINKVWSRKHIWAVTDSISVIDVAVGLLLHIPMLIKLTVINKDLPSTISELTAMTGKFVTLLIGVGLWVKGNEMIGFFSLMFHAMKKEWREKGDLIKTFLFPTAADKLLIILQKVAAIDNDIAPEEIDLIEQFAQQWQLPSPNLKPGRVEHVTTLSDLRQSMVDYLSLNPPMEQAAQLIDMVDLMIKADDVVTPEEQLIFDEVTGLINNYMDEEQNDIPICEVLLVPQNETHFTTIRDILPGLTIEKRRGGEIFVIGQFYSKNYAEAMCQKYIALNLFAVWEYK
ncbi:hypothetical protein QUF63_11115 [Anaerolineales bacterium HSG25]|nr:hypothetical protein [Anaerolineales bacterium HSG25]